MVNNAAICMCLATYNDREGVRVFSRHHFNPFSLFVRPSRLNKHIDSRVLGFLRSPGDDNITLALEVEIEVLATAKLERERCVSGENLGSIVALDNPDRLVDSSNRGKLRAQCQCININQSSNVGKKLTSSGARSSRSLSQPGGASSRNAG